MHCGIRYRPCTQKHDLGCEMSAARAGTRSTQALLGTLAVLGAGVAAGQASQQTQSAQQTQQAPQAQRKTIETVVVVGVTPLPDRGVPIELVPANVTFFSAADIDRLHPLDLTQYLNRAAGSVSINEAQDNPLQPDVQFRGFTASPLLGLPQGVVLYQDGVRINEPFGDTVNWALVPESAIATVTLTPGSNPTFGLNALGGALAVTTKDGFTYPGAHAEVEGGSFSRIQGQAEVGGKASDTVGYYVMGSYFNEDGWRDFSPSRAKQLFGDLSYRTDQASLGLSATYADTKLIGNGPSPVQLLEEDRRAIFTRPDQTENNMTMLNLSGSYQLGAVWRVRGVAYYRHSKIDTLNGDDSPFEECEEEDLEGLLCEEDGEPVLDRAGELVAFTPEVSGGTLNRSSTDQTGDGLSLQLGADSSIGGRANHFILGAAYDHSDVDFDSSTELGALDDTRAAVSSGIFAAEADVGLKTKTESYGVFFTDTFEVTSEFSINLAGRYNSVDIRLNDQLGEELNGHHKFSRFNPSGGFTYRPWSELQFYASVGEASRAPSPIELTCADPDAPCRLPNAFLSDPPLEQVVSRSVEVGTRGDLDKTHWHLGAFRSTNHDDIIFISSGRLTNEGFFANIGRTRREGIELNLSGTALRERLVWFANYTVQRATFEEDFTVASGNNPEAIDDEIPVQSGDHIPSIPEQILKLGIDYAFARHWSAGADLNYASSQYLRGDEGNLTPQIGGYAVLNLRAAFAPNEHFRVYVTVNNVFDRDYETFGAFGEADDVLGDDFDNPRFLSPGAPRAAWLGVRMAW